MKAIINGKLYDTEKAEKLYSFRRKVDKGPVLWMPGYNWMPYHDFNLYRTEKGGEFGIPDGYAIMSIKEAGVIEYETA